MANYPSKGYMRKGQTFQVVRKIKGYKRCVRGKSNLMSFQNTCTKAKHMDTTVYERRGDNCRQSLDHLNTVIYRTICLSNP